MSIAFIHNVHIRVDGAVFSFTRQMLTRLKIKMKWKKKYSGFDLIKFCLVWRATIMDGKIWFFVECMRNCLNHHSTFWAISYKVEVLTPIDMILTLKIDKNLTWEFP